MDISAPLASANTAINSLTVSEEVKTHLRTIVEARLREGAGVGLSTEQLQQLADELVLLLGKVDLTDDSPHFNAAAQLMIKGIREGFTAAEIGEIISAKLANGMDLKTALKETRSELKDKTPKSKETKEKPAKDDKGKEKDDGVEHGKK